MASQIDKCKSANSTINDFIRFIFVRTKQASEVTTQMYLYMRIKMISTKGT